MTLRVLVDLLFHTPALSAASIARKIGCGHRKVGRYRKLLHRYRIQPKSISQLDEKTLWFVFNARPVRRLHAAPDFPALRAANPGASGRGLWLQHRTGTGSLISYAQFMRLLAEHVAIVTATEEEP